MLTSTEADYISKQGNAEQLTPHKFTPQDMLWCDACSIWLPAQLPLLAAHKWLLKTCNVVGSKEFYDERLAQTAHMNAPSLHSLS
eukprot:c12876_g1_i1 orf=2-253(-)